MKLASILRTFWGIIVVLGGVGFFGLVAIIVAIQVTFGQADTYFGAFVVILTVYIGFLLSLFLEWSGANIITDVIEGRV